MHPIPPYTAFVRSKARKPFSLASPRAFNHHRHSYTYIHVYIYTYIINKRLTKRKSTLDVRESLLLDVYNREETWPGYVTALGRGEERESTLRGTRHRSLAGATLLAIHPERFETRPDDLLPDLIINPFRLWSFNFRREGGRERERFKSCDSVTVASLNYTQSPNFYRFDGRNDFRWWRWNPRKTIIFFKL